MRIILTTPRLTLREIAATDRDALLAIYGDPVAMAHYPAPFDAARMDDWIGRLALDSYALDGFGLWAVLETATGDLVGDCGITRQKTPYGVEPEIGWHVRRDRWGRGYATEAGRAALAYGRATLGLGRVVSIVAPDNAASCAVAARVHSHVDTYTKPDGAKRRLYFTE